MKDLRYLAAYSIPLVTVFGITKGGWFTYITPLYVFIVIPILEIILPVDSNNLSFSESKIKNKKKIFDWMLYINLPLVYAITLYSIHILSGQYTWGKEQLGVIISTGIVIGANGINVAHELGHRKQKFQRILAKILLLPALYMHFYIEHNYGHHLHAATKEDPATARINQSIYEFWFTSIFRQYLSAWKIQIELLKRQKHKFISVHNDMLWYSIIQAIYLISLLLLFGIHGLLAGILCAIIGIILLESINYIEHYGLLRLKKPSGRYERVNQIHSWNSNHTVGRIVLYELTRHSDHHFKSSKKYQLLEYHEKSPQLPYGYPTSMVISLIPPLWYSIMNKLIPSEMKEGR